MSRVLIDTSAYSEFMRGEPATIAALREADSIFLNATVLGELYAGFILGGRRAKNESELDRFLQSPRVDLLDVDDETAQRYAVILAALRAAGTSIPTNDLWIAASAMQHGLELLTFDAHFLRVPQILTRYIK